MKLKIKIALALALSSGLMMTACSKENEPEEQIETIQFNGIDQVEATLKNNGWNVMRPEPASFHLWESESPTEFLIAENSSGKSLVFGKFSTAEDAEKAYNTTVPESGESVKVQDTDQYSQTLVTLEDGSGSWVFRTSENWVVGGFILNPEDESAMVSLIESLQTAPSKTAPVTDTENNEDPTKNA